VVVLARSDDAVSWMNFRTVELPTIGINATHDK